MGQASDQIPACLENQIMLKNEMRSFRNRGYHQGYDSAKASVIQDSFDDGYKKAFEENFVLNTLKGVAFALKSSFKNRSTGTEARPISSSSLTSDSSSPSPSVRVQDEDSSCCESSTAVSNNDSTTTSTNDVNLDISSNNYLKLLESMKFDDANEIESIKKDLIKICHDKRLQILAHYVSSIR